MLFLFQLFRRKKQAHRTKKNKDAAGKGTPPPHQYEQAVELTPTLGSLNLKELKFGKPKKQQRQLEQNNEFIYGITAGTIGAVVKYGFNELMQWLNIAKYDNNATAITIVMKGYQHTPAFWIFGFANALFIGAFFGLIIAFMFSYVFNEKYYLLKGVGIGIGIWLFNFGVASNFFNYPEPLQYSLGDITSMLLSLVIFALVTVYSLKRLGFFKQ